MNQIYTDLEKQTTPKLLAFTDMQQLAHLRSRYRHRKYAVVEGLFILYPVA